MSDDWLPIATHGDSEETVRKALLEYADVTLSEFRMQLRAEGLPLPAIEKAMAFAEKAQREQIEKDLPRIMRNMAVSAIALH